MPQKTNDDALNALFAQTVADNPELRDRLTGIVNRLLDNVEYMLEVGDQKERLAYARMIVPGMLKGMHESRVDSASVAQREAMQRVMNAVRGGGGEVGS